MLEPFINTTEPTEDFSDFTNNDLVYYKDTLIIIAMLGLFVAFYLIHAMTTAIKCIVSDFNLSLKINSVLFEVGEGWRFDSICLSGLDKIKYLS